jgi:hypothetical protein
MSVKSFAIFANHETSANHNRLPSTANEYKCHHTTRSLGSEVVASMENHGLIVAIKITV